MQRTMRVWNLGRMRYGEALRVQMETADWIKRRLAAGDDATGVLLLVEHKPVYTVGLRTKGYGPEEEQRLTGLGAEFCRTDRGGLITFHGPGQLVAYPIVNLHRFRPSVKWYVASLERTVIAVCNQFGVAAATSPVNPGVWVRDNKVCAVGVHGSRFVMTHGIALNCNVDLRWFEHIVPCGIEGKGVTTLSRETGKTLTPDDVAPVFVQQFGEHFECVMKDTKAYTNLDDVLTCLSQC